MKSNQKGFTLIELLAVIVILAIIALIATPIILNIVSKARKSAAADSAYGVMKAVELAYAESIIDGKSYTFPLNYTCTDTGCTCTDSTTGTAQTINVVYKGTLPTNGGFTLSEDGKYTFDAANGLVVNNYKCTIDAAGKVSCD